MQGAPYTAPAWMAEAAPAVQPEAAPKTRLNRRQRRILMANMRQPHRTDGLPKVGYSWTAWRTRIDAYRKERAVKLTRERAARRRSAA